MPRSTNSPAGRNRHKKVLKRAKGFRQGRSRLYQFAKQFTEKGLNYAWVGRRLRKRERRSLWIIKINAATRTYGLTYHQFINGLQTAGVKLDRKILSELAVSDAPTFEKLTTIARENLSRPKKPTTAKK